MPEFTKKCLSPPPPPPPPPPPILFYISQHEIKTDPVFLVSVVNESFGRLLMLKNIKL